MLFIVIIQPIFNLIDASFDFLIEIIIINCQICFLFHVKLDIYTSNSPKGHYTKKAWELRLSTLEGSGKPKIQITTSHA